ncbi:MAG: response regulator [Vicingaceae bacterium]
MKIFIVEDDPVFAEKFKKEIELTMDHEVMVYRTAERAMGLLSLKPDLVFVDHYLKGVNGTDIIELILDKLPECTVVSVSSQTDIRILEQSVSSGAYRYIEKNEDFSENLAKLFYDLELKNTPESSLKKISNFFQFPKKREKPLVYIVDDDEVFGFLVNYKIEQLNSYNVETFTDGYSAINNACKKPDVLLLDYNLKNMKGSVVMERYKQMSPETKIVMISSQTEVGVAAKLIGKGAVDYVVKGEESILNIKKALNRVLN